MPTIISTEYLERLCLDRQHEGLVWISSVLCGSPRFAPDDPVYGLPSEAFSLVERLNWFAQGLRSGAWTYFEATPPARQTAMLVTLEEDASYPAFAEHYRIGMRDWKTPSALSAMDKWLDAHDQVNNTIAWQIISSNRSLIRGLANATD